MKRFLAALPALLVVAVASAGCNASSVPAAAAYVASAPIPTARLDASMAELKSDSGYLCQGGAGAIPVTSGVGTGTWSSTFSDFVLTQLIKFRILDQMVAARQLVAPASDKAVATAEAESSVAQDLTLLQQQSPPVTCQGTPSTIIGSLGPSFRTALIGNQMNEDAYSAYLAGTSLQPAALASWKASHPYKTTQSCTSVIQVASATLAARIHAAVHKGASFATEAAKYSQNTGAGKGGAVGCVLESQWTGTLGPVVAGLKVGAVSAPVKFQSTWLLFLVTKRQPEPSIDVVPQIDQQESSAFSSAYSKVLGTAAISVSPVYGSLQRKAVPGGFSLAVVPPSAKACAYAVSPAAAGCATTVTTPGTTPGVGSSGAAGAG